MTEPVGLYIHIPFCLKKCHYCSFWSEAVDPEAAIVADYIDALIEEVQEFGLKYAQEGVRTLYIGGGTPSMLPPRLLEKLLEAVDRSVPQLTEREFTLEANPGTLSGETLRVVRDSPVNRLSLGIQAANDTLLAQIGRIHTWPDAQKAFADARAIGLDNISVDLIYGLPGQDRADWQRTLAKVGDLAPDHVSAYGLQVEASTVLADRIDSGAWALPDEEDEAAMAEDTDAILAKLGLRRYEISSYCRPGRESRHNGIYWHNEAYRGLGAGAFSYEQRIRSAHVHDIREYIHRMRNRLPLDDWQETRTLTEEMEETMMMTLRLVAGVSVDEFQQRFGQDPRVVFATALARLTADGLIRVTRERIAPTPLGLRFNNRVGREIIGSLS
jgi:oxygen-independent coproporphyrinogen III oxidase